MRRVKGMSKFLSTVFISLIVGLVTTPAWSYSYVLEVEGKPTLSFDIDGEVSYMPITEDTILTAGSNLILDTGERVLVACDSDARLRKEVIKTTPVKVICPPKKRKKASAMRGDGDNNDYPMILSPRDNEVLAIKDIKWRHSGHGSYRILIDEADGKRFKIIDGKTEIANNVKRNEIQTYSLKEYQDKLQPGKRYEIRIEKVKENKSSRLDSDFSGVVKIATHTELEEFESYRGSLKKSLKNEAKINYYYAIYLSEKGYYTDSNRYLDNVNISNLTEYVSYLRLTNNKYQKIPNNILIIDWLRLLNRATTNENIAVALMACDEIKQAIPNLSMDWKNKINQLSKKNGFKKYCRL